MKKIVADERYTPVTVAWFVYQNNAYCFTMPDTHTGKGKPARLIDTIRTRLPKGLEEIAPPGRTMHARCDAILAYVDIGVSNGPVEAINGRLEHLRGIARGFRNLTHYILTGPAALRPTPAHLLSTLDHEEPDKPCRAG